MPFLLVLVIVAHPASRLITAPKKGVVGVSLGAIRHRPHHNRHALMFARRHHHGSDRATAARTGSQYPSSAKKALERHADDPLIDSSPNRSRC